MSNSTWEIWTLVIAIIEFDISYYLYSKTGSLLNVLFVIVASLILALAFIVSHIYSNIKDLVEKQEEMEKRFIREKELEDIRLDLREIKTKVKIR